MEYKLTPVTENDQKLFRITFTPSDSETFSRVKEIIDFRTPFAISNFLIGEECAIIDINADEHYTEAVQLQEIDKMLKEFDVDPRQKEASVEHEIKRCYSEIAELRRQVKNQENTITHLNKYIDFLETKLS